jgi:multiple sugar transport system permease protein
LQARDPGRGTTLARAGYALAVAAALVVWLLPLAGIAYTSMHSLEDLNAGNVWGWPLHPALADNFRTVLGGSGMGVMAFNSFVVTLPAVFFTVLLSAMAGFALAKHRFPGNRLLLMIFVAGNLVPLQVLMIPVRDLMIALRLYDTRMALVVFHTAFQTGFCTLFMRNFIRDVPDTLLDTARVDGAGEIAIFFRVVLPLIRPAIAAVSVLIFTFVWNDYFWSLVLVQSDAIRPLTAGLQTLRGMWQTSWNLVAAASLLAAVPPVVLFFLMQKHLISGLTGAQHE